MNKILSIFLVFLIAVSFASARQAPSWDKSSLVFEDTSSDCGMITATVCNHGDDMAGTTNYFVYYSEDGNPKDGDLIETSTLGPLDEDECVDLVFSGDLDDGNYKFKANQRYGHPGIGSLWSDTVEYNSEDCNEVPEFGVVAGSLALIAGLGIVAYKRK